MQSFTEFITESVDEKSPVIEKIDELTKAFYADKCSRERRIDGYTYYMDSSRKFRMKENSDKTDFFVEIVNKSDESFVAEIGGCMNKSIDDIKAEVKEY